MRPRFPKRNTTKAISSRQDESKRSEGSTVQQEALAQSSLLLVELVGRTWPVHRTALDSLVDGCSTQSPIAAQGSTGFDLPARTISTQESTFVDVARYSNLSSLNRYNMQIESLRDVKT